tara:strand:- start:125 stop:409 length:285 start_codon:yes stop_codon:yes gene_type:complete
LNPTKLLHIPNPRAFIGISPHLCFNRLPALEKWGVTLGYPLQADSITNRVVIAVGAALYQRYISSVCFSATASYAFINFSDKTSSTILKKATNF